MASRTWMYSLVACLIGLSGCSLLALPDSKAQAHNRWDQVRGRLKFQLAAESFTAGQLDEAQRQLKEATGLDPRSPQNYVLQAKILLERGEVASASEALQEASRCGGNSVEIDYLNGVIAQRYGRFEQALQAYQKASEREPGNAHYVAAVAETLVSLNQPASALQLVVSRRTDFEQNATLRTLAGELYMMLGRYEEAADSYREAARIAPDDTLIQNQLGVALAFSKHYEEAADVLAGLCASQQDVAPSTLLALGRCQLALNKLEDAKASLRRAVTAAPGSTQAWALLARASLGTGDLLTAREAAGRAAEIEPGSTDQAILLGYVCSRQRDFAAAARTLEQVLKTAPQDALALYLLGEVRQAMGDAQAAERCFERARRIKTEAGWAAQVSMRDLPDSVLMPSGAISGDQDSR